MFPPPLFVSFTVVWICVWVLTIIVVRQARTIKRLREKVQSCHTCGKPSVINVNGMECCGECFEPTMNFVVDVLALERGIPIEEARRVIAKLFRQAMEGN